MVGVAQMVERWIVAPVVVGSSPIAHPFILLIAYPGEIFSLAQVDRGIRPGARASDP